MDALRPRGIGVDEAGFKAEMQRQKEKARAAWAGSGEAATEKLWFELRDRFGATEFLGYETEKAEGQILALIKAGKEVKQLKKGEEGAVITNQTPFYGASGGQVGDEGFIYGAKGVLFRVTATEKELGDLFVHHGVVEKGPLKVGEAVELEVDHARRSCHPRQSFGHAPAARGAAAGARHACRAERLAGRAGASALRLFAPQADDARRKSRPSKTSRTP